MELAPSPWLRPCPLFGFHYQSFRHCLVIGSYITQLNSIQAQLTQDAETERRAPTVDSKGIGAGDMDKRRKWSTDFPKYEEGQYELHPGAKKQSELDKEERERRKRDPGDDH